MCGVAGLLLVLILWTTTAQWMVMREGMTGDDADNANDNNTDTTDAATGSKDYDHYNHYRGGTAPVMFHGPSGGTAKLVNTGKTNVIVVTQSAGNTCKYALVKGSTNVYACADSDNTATVVTSTDGTKTVVLKIDGKKVVFTATPPVNTNIGATSNAAHTGGEINTVGATVDQEPMTTASGIPKSQILPGQEDLYVLKSQMVPPVCPKCPDPVVTTGGKVPPPCPPCARCPEPAFDCKKVPNYTAFNPSYMPIPAQSASTFGM